MISALKWKGAKIKMEYKIVEKITRGGSNRIFYRCKMGKETYILVWDRDIGNYLKLHKHLYDRKIAVPQIHWADEHSNMLLMEDLGNDSLYELVKRKKNIFPLYHAALKALVKLQLDGFTHAPVHNFYDFEHVRWEQEYFKKHFLVQYCKIPKKKLRVIDDDLNRLAEELIAKAKPWANFLMHRDYQSQNIYIKNGKAKIIDFQSARIGPLTYDLAALLRDAYVTISEKEERAFIDDYLACLKKKRIKPKKREFLYIYHLTGLQRNMQALGAFANLSLNKNKIHFKKYIPRGLKLLQSGLMRSPFEDLLKLVTSPAVSSNVF